MIPRDPSFPAERSDNGNGMEPALSGALWNQWTADWSRYIRAMTRKEMEVRPLNIRPPATRAEVAAVRSATELILPTEFVDVVTRFSAEVSFGWEVWDLGPEEYAVHGCFGDWIWSLAGIADMRRRIRRQLWHVPGKDVDDWFDGVTKDRTPFLFDEQANLFAFDVSNGETNCPVVYISAFASEFNGRRFGLNFPDFITRWSALGCPGPSLDHFLPFYDEKVRLLMIDGPTVDGWRKWVFSD